MKNSIRLLGLSAFAIAYSTSAFCQDPIVEQANRYNAIYGSSLTANTTAKIAGVVNLKTVLPGFVYRGGSSYQVEGPLSETALVNLCEAGFSSAIYAYPTKGGFQQHSVPCSKGTLEYYGYSGENSIGRGKAMDVIAAAIQNLSGPVFVHCWNGLHSSGNFSGSALMTFCDESFSQAAAYWDANAGSPAAKKGSKFEGEKHTGVNLSSEARQALCGN